MTIVQEFIERNESLLDKVAEDNPNLGGALAEAFAVIDFFAKSNNVTFDDAQKEAILTTPPIVTEVAKQEDLTQKILKNIEERVRKSKAEASVWVIESADKDALSELSQGAADVHQIVGRIEQGERFNAPMYFLILDKEIPDISEWYVTSGAADAYLTQKEITQEELDKLLKGEGTSVEQYKWVTDTLNTTYATKLFAMTVHFKNSAIMREANDRFYIISDERQEAAPHIPVGLKSILLTQTRLAMSVIDQMTLSTPAPAPPQTIAEESRWVTVTTSAATSKILLELTDSFGNVATERETGGYYYVISDEKQQANSNTDLAVQLLIEEQRLLNMSVIDRMTLGTSVPETTHAHSQHTPTTHAPKEFLGNDVLDDLDLGDLPDLDLDSVDLDYLDDLELGDLDI